MFSRDRQSLKHDHSRESQTHAHYLLLALSRAAQAIQRAHTAEDFYSAVGREIQSLGGDVALLLLDEDRKSLSIAYLSYAPELIRKGEQMTGLTQAAYQIPITPGGIYERTLQGRTAVYTASAIEILKESLPKSIQALGSPLATIFNLRQGVLAPLWVDDEALGLLTVGGAFLSHDDLPAMDSFAGHIATGLYNLRLMQKLKDELAARRLAEEALRISQSTFEGIFNSITETIYIQDENGVFLDVNEGAERMYGYPREHFIGRTPEFLSAPGRNDLETIMGYVRQAFLGQPAEFEFWGIKKDGTVLPKDVRLTPGMYFGRNVVIAVARDITEKKQAEHSLRQQFNNLRSVYQMAAALGQSSDLEEVFNKALDSLENTLAVDRAAVLLFDPDGVMRFKSWRGLSETYRKIAEGHSPWKPDDPDPQPVLVQDALNDPGFSQLVSAFEAEGIGSLGFIPILYQGKLLGKFMIYFNEKHFYHEEEVQLAQTIARHVAFAISRRQADDALRASVEMYRIFYEDNPSMYFTADENGSVLSVNKFGISQLGFTPEELIGQPIINIFHPDDKEGVRLQIESCLENPQRTVQIEARKVDKNGRIRWVRESACAVRDVEGHLVVLVTCDDITKRKQAEDELRHANRSLQAAHKELQQMFEHEQVLARTDVLTGLFNRRHFFDLAVREFNGSLRYKRQLALILFDVDGFKKANDTFGHGFGDETLIKISQAAKSQVREVDILARYGGDEFVILMPQTNAEQAFLLAERIRKAVETADIDVEGIALSATISLGVAEIAPAIDSSVESIISRADKALYQAKQSGRNHAVIYSAG